MMFTTGETVGLALAEWLNDDTCLVTSISFTGQSKIRAYECVDNMVSLKPGYPPAIGPLTAFFCERESKTSPCQHKSRNISEEKDAESSKYSKDLCIPKCCPNLHTFDEEKRRCVKSLPNKSRPDFFLPQLPLFSHIFPHDRLGKFARMELKEYLLENQYPLLRNSCKEGMIPLHKQNIIPKLLDDGSLFYEGLGAWDNDFCVDMSHDNHKLLAFKCASTLNDYRVTEPEFSDELANDECFGERMMTFMKSLRLAYVVCGCFSIIFLAATLYVYLTLPSLRNLHGKIVVSNIIAILLTTILLLILFNVRAKSEDADLNKKENNNNSSSEFIIDLSPIPCKTVGYLTYYSGITMFTWMSVLCYDLGWTFARAKIPRKGTDYVKFLLYSLVAWGSPLLLLLLVALVDNDIIPLGESSVRPDVGQGSCFLSIKGLQRYFYLPISIMLSFNTIMFIVTVYALWKTKKFARKAGLKKISSSRPMSQVHNSNRTVQTLFE